MNNFLRIMALDESNAPTTTFISARNEGGINVSFDPSEGRFTYQVFIHSRFPYFEIERWEFEAFEKARGHAAKLFAEEWEMLGWDLKTDRPCEKEGRECGSGQCETCKSLAQEEADLNEGYGPDYVQLTAVEKAHSGHSGCGSCGMG